MGHKLQGQPLRVAFKDTAMMAEAAKETKQSLKQMALIEAFRLFKAKKEKQRAAADAIASKTSEDDKQERSTFNPKARVEGKSGDAKEEEDEEEDKPKDPRL